MFEKVRAVDARRPFGPIWRFRAVLENTPGVQSPYKAAITKNGWCNFWAQGSNLEDYFRLACDDSRDGRGRKTHEQHPPRGPWRGYRGGFFSLILISLLEMRSTRFEARGLGGLTQTKASELKLHSFFPQGHWSARTEAELAKRRQFT